MNTNTEFKTIDEMTISELVQNRDEIGRWWSRAVNMNKPADAKSLLSQYNILGEELYRRMGQTYKPFNG
jgi:hypothetical protein